MPETIDLDTVLANIDEIGGLISANAAQGESERRVGDDVMQALHASGALRTLAPTRSGGTVSSVRGLLQVSRQVGLYDGGTSWVVTLASLGNWLSTIFSERAQQELRSGKPNAVVSGVVQPSAVSKPVDGGYMVSGKWYYNSSSWYSDAAVLGLPLLTEAGELETVALILIPREDYEIEDTWFTAGMRSSASNCIVVQDVFVPHHRIVTLPAASAGEYPGLEVVGHDDVNRASLGALFCLGLVGPLLGIGTAALEFVRSRMDARNVAYTVYDRQAESTAHQVELAKAATLIDTAHLHAFRAADLLDEAARNSRQLSRTEFGQVRADTGWAADCIIEAIGKLITVHGAGAFAEASPLQRMWRDANTANRHAAVTSITAYESYGKALVGSPIQISMFG